MKTEIGVNLLTIERDRLKEMIDDLEKDDSFEWGEYVCPVYSKAKEFMGLGQMKCANCRLFGIFARCDYIGDFLDEKSTYSISKGRTVFNKGEKKYLQDLFANYIRQIDEQLEELK